VGAKTAGGNNKNKKTQSVRREIKHNISRKI
jgi:hypothetical protein